MKPPTRVQVEVNIDWLSSNGEVYHRSCVHWTPSLEAGNCECCGQAIPEPVMQLARRQRSDRDRWVRDRDVR